MDFDPPSNSARMIPQPVRPEADQLREQAAACRRLAGKARTRAGSKALEGLGDHFDERARKLDPSSLRK